MISVERLTKTYGEINALDSVTFTVEPGRICGYLGPNGAGKTTTVRILTGVLRQTSGRAVVCGFDVGERPLEVKRRIGYVPETGAIYSTLSSNEFLTLIGTFHEMPPELLAVRSKQMLEFFDIEKVADHRIDTLSKGMRQKVIITAALLHDPDVILLDEPLAGLDANAARMIKDILKGLADRGKTILFCSHMLDVVERLCDRVIILDEGSIVADGNPKDLMTSEKTDTLEKVFIKLTGMGDYSELAQALIETVDSPQRSKDTPRTKSKRSKKKRRGK